ncbi:hypothetical protein E1B28_012061 [Marasmius oreades]|uniref:Uncharacterized protein n=1 Tax=Marasmius oreades TaxID=181124 RepID=A0A9P7UQD9_9AGAR|nr:uncharacterized protein E1B28_012061 [Marasmius oreades]KAG7088024.1 hypothetical protein E1B28_012061 [Marasmius oreades]
MSGTAQIGRLRSKHTRPNSAVYIGSDPLQLQQIGSTPPSLPDLPEPPSPVSSIGSGLPSPPATNSTGSGSTGDPASIALRGGTKGNMPLLEENYVKAFHAAFEQQQQRPQGQHRYETADDDDDIDNQTNNSNELYAHDDDTAKFPRSQSNANNDNALALERVKSLQERNRMVLNKLSSYSRLSTPSPNPSLQSRSKDTISRIESASSHSSSSSSSRPSLARNHRHSYQPDTHTQTTASPRQDLSGSETERESVRGGGNSYHEDDDDDESGSPSSILLNHTSTISRSVSAKTPGRPITPSQFTFNSNTYLSPRSARTRLISAPASPGKALSSISRSTSGSGSGQTGSQSPLSSPGKPRKRASMGPPSMSYSVDLRGRDQEDVTSAALEAVANSRRGVGGGGGSVNAAKRRQPLPREFWEGSGRGRRASLGSNGHADDAEEADSLSHERDPSISSQASSSRHQYLQPQTEPRPSAATLTPGGRRRFHNGRNNSYRRTSGAWASEDLGNRTSEFAMEDEGLPSPVGRRQALRQGGSADSVLTIGAGQRSLIGEGLKAAGLSRRGDVFGGSARSPVFERERDTEREREREERIERIRSQSRASSRTGHGRAVTAMAEYSNSYDDADDEPEPRTNLRPFKSAYPLVGRDREMDDRDRLGERAPSALSQDKWERVRGPQFATPTTPSQSITSPMGTRRFNTISSTITDMSRSGTEGSTDGALSSRSRAGVAIDRSDHTRLLTSSLELFENALSKIPSSSSSSTASNTSDLVRNARVIVGAVEKLNGLLKAGHGRALNAQIDCEVQAAGGGGTGSSGNAEEIWRLVGGEYREGLRVSDDLVRAVTDFMLGVGRAVKDMGIAPHVANGESSSNGDNLHTRSVSLDEAGVGRKGRVSLSPDVTGGSGGARSTGTGSATSGGARSRRSWEPTPGRDTEALRRLAVGQRAETSLGVLTNERNHTPLNRTTKRIPTPTENGIRGSIRRLLTPREIREQQLVRNEDVPRGMSTFDSQETVHASAYEPSPTPASRAASRAKQVAQERSPHPAPDRSKTLPAISIPPPLPVLPSENRRTPSSTNKGTPDPNASTLSRRKTTQAVSSTVRGPSFPLTTPNVPTTAVTTTHVSGSPEQRAFPLVRENSNTSSSSGGGPRSSVTFSRFSTTSALSGLQQQQQRAEQQRNRAFSNSSDVRDDSFDHHNEVNSPAQVPPGALKGKVAAAAGRLQRVISTGGGSETEKDVYRKSGGTVKENSSRASRISFDESTFSVGVNRSETSSSAHPADRAAVSVVSQGKRERRRTVVDMWPRGGS